MQTSAQLRDFITAALSHLDHVLPGQAPILDFVHHNTLHGFQHLPFEEALEKFEALTGICGYLPEAQYRNFYRQGRINDRDIDAALAQCPTLAAEEIVCTINNKIITRKDLYRIALLYDLPTLTPTQLHWQITEMQALTRVQADVPTAVKKQLLGKGDEGTVIKQLWESIAARFDFDQPTLHPETLLDLAEGTTEDWLASAYHPITAGFLQTTPKQRNKDAYRRLKALIDQVGDSLSLRGFIMALTGTDILDNVRPHLIRICASVMDEGVAPWPMPERQAGLYSAWRATATYDANLFLHELPGWQQIMEALPEDAIDTIILHLTHLGVPQKRWSGYLQRLALELPGWSGLINWRQQHPNYPTANASMQRGTSALPGGRTANASMQRGTSALPGGRAAPLTLADYLAIRLTLDRLWLNQVCQNTWKISANLNVLRHYFIDHLAEFTVRHALYQGNLPEFLTQRVENLITLAKSDWQPQPDWTQLSDLIHTWKARSFEHPTTPYNIGWRLFRLHQHLGLRAEDIKELYKNNGVGFLLSHLVGLDTVTERAKIWLVAYETHYRDAFFQGLNKNHNRGRWAKRDTRPEAQLIFCMDDREEGFRRHLEELNPALETLGAAGFFGVPMNYQGLDDTQTTPLCPIVVTPINAVQERPRSGNERVLARHQRGRKLLLAVANTLHQCLRRNLVMSQPLVNIIAPVTLIGLLAKTLFPKTQERLVEGIAQRLSPTVDTELFFNAPDPSTEATLAAPKLGFTDNEQANRVAGFLRNTGLTYGFAPLVVLLGHGSMSQNNPHLAAYDCGACSGRHGGPNARAFAAMANRPTIRQMLAERGISIPADTWFIGAEHNTCHEEISWYDLNGLPAGHRPALQKLQAELHHAQLMSAHERCRRLASAPRNPSPKQALRHIAARASDFSQARPELGHATNAAAVIGRRSLTQGTFFDRRVFLISYDPTQDPDGKIVEGILLAVGPVGAGINLEYYFSTVNNERFGCGSKVPHNVTGFFGVMEGAGSDLRTGLPQQMVEIHEAMRLQILVEAKTMVLERIYADQESLRELIAGGWVHLSTKDPDSGEIFVFERGVGFVPWQAAVEKLPVKANSPACYEGQTLPVAPALIVQPDTLTIRCKA